MVETAQRCIKGRIDKQRVAYTCNRILLSHKKRLKFWYMLQCSWTLKILCKLREVRHKSHILHNPLICDIHNRKIYRDRIQFNGYQCLGTRNWEELLNGLGILLWSDKNVLELDRRSVYTTLWIYSHYCSL